MTNGRLSTIQDTPFLAAGGSLPYKLIQAVFADTRDVREITFQ